MYIALDLATVLDLYTILLYLEQNVRFGVRSVATLVRVRGFGCPELSLPASVSHAALCTVNRAGSKRPTECNSSPVMRLFVERLLSVQMARPSAISHFYVHTNAVVG